jgi:DUF4097 and DUF4098 domain-containing protein YvlB
VVVSYPDGNTNASGQLTGRIDLGVWLPSWVTVEFETDFGDIKVKKSASNVVAKSVSGKISVGTAGLIDASSQSGNISVDFYNEDYRWPMKVSSETGNVKVNVSKNAKLTLKAYSYGPIKNNFAAYQSIQFSQQKKTMVVNLSPVELSTKWQPAILQVSALRGDLTIHIADKTNHKIKRTSRH